MIRIQCFIHSLFVVAILAVAQPCAAAETAHAPAAPISTTPSNLHPQRSFKIQREPAMRPLLRGGPPTRQFTLPRPNALHFRPINQTRFFPLPKSVGSAIRPAPKSSPEAIIAAPAHTPSSAIGTEDPLDLLMPPAKPAP